MEKVLGYYSNKGVEETRKCDVFVLLENKNSNQIYSYLPRIEKYMSLSEEEYINYHEGVFSKKLVELTENEFKMITQ